MFIGSQPAWTEQPKRGLAYRRTEETAFCSTAYGRNGILFIGRDLAYHKTEGTDLLRSKRGPIDREGCGVPQNRGNRLVLERYGRNGGPVDQEVCGVPQNRQNRPPTVETGVLFIGRGVAYRKTEETDLCWSATAETGVMFIERGVAYRKTGLHGILFISTVDLLQPPRAIVDLL